MRTALLIGLTMLAAVAARGEWKRTVSSGKGDSRDAPPPHPLAYFRLDPCARPSSDSVTRALDCDAPSGQKHLKDVNIRRLGTAGAFVILELTYVKDGPAYPNQDVKSIVLRTNTGQYREIDVRDRHGNAFPDSTLLDVHGIPVLDVRSHDGGQNILIEHRLYTFDAAGANLIDLSPVEAAVKAVMPANMSIRLFDDDFAAGAHYVAAYRNDLNLPPAAVKERARITISYRLDGTHVVVTGSQFEPFEEP